MTDCPNLRFVNESLDLYVWDDRSFLGLAHDFRAKILAQCKKNPDFEAPEFSVEPTSQASEPGLKFFWTQNVFGFLSGRFGQNNTGWVGEIPPPPL